MENKRKNKIVLLFAVSLMALCLIAGGCTSQAEPGETAPADKASQNQPGSPAEASGPADSGMERPEMTGEMPEGEPPEGMNMTGGPGGMGGPGEGRGGPDFASAAEALGVTEDQLIVALGGMGGGAVMDLDSAASELGVTVEELEAALGFTGEMPPGGAEPEGMAGRAPPENNS